jgi:alpha-beta hydrolase superfamily lysophospholipase
VSAGARPSGVLGIVTRRHLSTTRSSSNAIGMSKGGTGSRLRGRAIAWLLFVGSCGLGSCSRSAGPPSIQATGAEPPRADGAKSSSEVRTGTLVTYKGGHEILREDYRDDGEILVSKLTLPGSTATVRTSRKDRRVQVDVGPRHVERAIPPGTISLENGDWQAYTIAAEWYADAHQPMPVQVLVPGQGVTAEGRIAVTAGTGGERHVALELGPLTIDVDIGPDGRVVHARVPVQGLEVRPSPSPPSSAGSAPAAAGALGSANSPAGSTSSEPRADRPAQDADAVRYAVEVHQGDLLLAGELVVPRAAPRPLPLIAIVAGSGPTDRDGNNNIGLHTDAYKQMAEAAVKRGLATLRYDKRGIGQSRGFREEDGTLAALGRDLVAMVEASKRKDQFSKVVLAGHSEGGIIALQAFRESGASALVLLATPGRPLADVLRDQLVRKGVPAADVAAAIAAARRGEVPASERRDIKMIFRASVLPFLQTLLDVDPSELFRGTTLPTIIVQGDSDRQVGVDDARRLHAARPDARLVVVHEMTHALKTDPEGGTRSYTDPSLPIADAVIDALVEASRR